MPLFRELSASLYAERIWDCENLTEPLYIATESNVPWAVRIAETVALEGSAGVGF